jgi:hypothetical protein
LTEVNYYESSRISPTSGSHLHYGTRAAQSSAGV